MSATTRAAAGGGGATGATTTSSTARSSTAGSPRATSSSTPTYSGNRYGTLRSEVEHRLAGGRSVVLEIEVQGARQVRAAMPESVQIFIAPPDPAVLRSRLEGRGTDSHEAIERRLEDAQEELAAQDEFGTRSSTTTSSVQPTSWRHRARRAGARSTHRSLDWAR